MHKALTLALFVPLLAGCVGDEQLAGADTPSEEEAPWLIQWTGQRLQGPPHDAETNPPPFMDRPPRPACDGANCERFEFEVPAIEGDVLVAIEWEGQDETYSNGNPPGDYLGAAAVGLDLVVLRDGRQIVDGVESFHYASVARLRDPAPGTYVAEVVARWGSSSYIGSVSIAPTAPALAAGEPLLPDLVTLPPDHLTITVPIGHEANAALGTATPGCGPDEVAEDQERRCLRFAGIIGNQGPGDFQADLQYDQAQGSLLGAGQWEQRLFLAGGGHETIPIAQAQYHPVHGHFHILDFVETRLYEYDEETGERGADTGFGRKTGFCIIDGGLIDPLQPIMEPKYHGNGCCYIAGFCQLDMLSYDHFSMGMSAGWYDIYPWWRADQYVEITGVPDGTYELVSVINPYQNMMEADVFNNEGSTIFRLTGNQVEMLSMHTQANVGPHPDADWG